MDSSFYIPSFYRKEFNKLYVKSIVYFLSIFLMPLLLYWFYGNTKDKVLITIFSRYSIFIIILCILIFIILFIYSRIKFINMMKTVYYIKDNKIIKGYIDDKRVTGKKSIKDFLFSSFMFEKRYNMKFSRINNKGITRLSNLIDKNTDYKYVSEHFFTDIYKKVEYNDYKLSSENSSKYIYRLADKPLVISKLYTNNELYLDYKNYRGNSGLFKDGLSKFILIILEVLLICLIDLFISYAYDYENKVKKITDNISYHLIDFGYSKIENESLKKLEYVKDNSNISVSLNDNGNIVDLGINIYIDGFQDLATSKYIFNDLAECSAYDIGNFINEVESCIDNSCIPSIDMECKKYVFYLKKELDKYVLIN